MAAFFIVGVEPARDLIALVYITKLRWRVILNIVVWLYRLSRPFLAGYSSPARFSFKGASLRSQPTVPLDPHVSRIGLPTLVTPAHPCVRDISASMHVIYSRNALVM